MNILLTGATGYVGGVLLPELDRSIYGSEARLEELEQEDAIWMRSVRTA
jgi:nucleoside-diphosphate-sugar epimerase